MNGEPQTERLDASTPRDIAAAGRLIRQGGTVAFPTETVYGLGANALDPNAVAKIFKAKERPGWDPLIVHIADKPMLALVAAIPPQAAPRVEAIMYRFWPGPLTLLLPRTPAIPDAVTAGRALVGVRWPAHPVAQALIREAEVPVAAPSANRFGRLSPTEPGHVLAGLDGRIDALLDGGICSVGVESTVLDPLAWPMILYRPGAVSIAMLEELCGPGSVELFIPLGVASTPEALPSPGVGIRHYAPQARLVLVPVPPAGFKDRLFEAFQEASVGGEPVGVMLPDGWFDPVPRLSYAWGPWSEPAILAHRLFAGLHALDSAGAATIVCPVPKGPGIAEALRDRLEKAARPQ